MQDSNSTSIGTLIAKHKDVIHWVPDGLVEGGDADHEGRNRSLFSAGCWMQDRGFEDETIILAVEIKNATFNPPLDKHELNQVIRQILKYPKGEDIVIRYWKELQKEGKFVCAYWDTEKKRLMVTEPQFLFDALKKSRDVIKDAYYHEKLVKKIVEDEAVFDDEDDGLDLTVLSGGRKNV
jgi:hypothetical protein